MVSQIVPPCHERTYSQSPQVILGQAHGSQSRVEVGGYHLLIVEADHGYIIGNPLPIFT